MGWSEMFPGGEGKVDRGSGLYTGQLGVGVVCPLPPLLFNLPAEASRLPPLAADVLTFAALLPARLAPRPRPPPIRHFLLVVCDE